MNFVCLALLCKAENGYILQVWKKWIGLGMERGLRFGSETVKFCIIEWQYLLYASRAVNCFSPVLNSKHEGRFI